MSLHSASGGGCDRRCIGCSGNFETELAHCGRLHCAPCGVDICDVCIVLHIMVASEDLGDGLEPAGREGSWSMGPPAGLFHDAPADVWDN
eukprot:7143610-Alexandrium_andersonii.AAC.1